MRKLTIALLSVVAVALLAGPAGAAIIVTPDSANSSVGSLSGRTITETINESGLDTTAASIEDWYHDQNRAGDGDFYWIGVYTTPELTFTFNSAVTVDTVHFWTYDRASDSPNREFKDFDISFSTDNGSTFSGTTSLTGWLDRDDARVQVDDGAGGTVAKIGHQSRSFTEQAGVTDIKFSNIINYGDNSYTGFSEVKFSAIPEPASLSLLMLVGGACFILRRRFRK